MRPFVLLVFTFLALAWAEAVPGVIQVGVQKLTAENPEDDIFYKRQVTKANLDYHPGIYTYYSIDFCLGTPPQNFSAAIDTGSSDLWVYGDSNSGCLENSNHDSDAVECHEIFHSKDSSSFKLLDKSFSISYGNGAGHFSGDHGIDTLTADGGIKLTNFTFGIANNGTEPKTVFGIGYKANEANDLNYPNLPILLKSQGYAGSVSYSLNLGNEDSGGNIIFGGLDHAKYVGPLHTLPLINVDDDGNPTSSPIAFIVNVSSVTNGSHPYIQQQSPYLLASASPLIYAPDDLVQSLADKYGYTKDPNYKYYTGSCDIPDDSVIFNFGSYGFDLKLRNTLLPFGEPGNCVLGFYKLSDAGINLPILGQTFLKSAYVVFDLENDEVSIAESVSSSHSFIEPILSGQTEFQEPSKLKCSGRE